MFEVSFTPKQRKNYLFYSMMFLFDNDEPSDKEYLEFLQCLADKYFYDVYLNADCLNERNQPRPNAFDSAILKDGELNVDEIGIEEVDYKEVFRIIYRQGKYDIPLFVFNYTDYMLWKKYADALRGNKLASKSPKRRAFFEDLGCNDFELEPLITSISLVQERLWSIIIHKLRLEKEGLSAQTKSIVSATSR